MNASQRHYSDEGIKTQADYSSNLWLSLNTFAGTELLKALKSHSFILDIWWYLLQELKLEVELGRWKMLSLSAWHLCDQGAECREA